MAHYLAVDAGSSTAIVVGSGSRILMVVLTVVVIVTLRYVPLIILLCSLLLSLLWFWLYSESRHFGLRLKLFCDGHQFFVSLQSCFGVEDVGIIGECLG
jgi:hypothetical protein